MNLDARYRLSPDAAIRPERFGGLVYRHDNRRLYFLHSSQLVDFVRELDSARPLAQNINDFLASRSLPDSNRGILVRALTQLKKLGVLDEV